MPKGDSGTDQTRERGKANRGTDPKPADTKAANPPKSGPADSPTAANSATADTAMADSVGRIAEQSQRLMQDFLSRHAKDFAIGPDAASLGRAFFEMTSRLMGDPA